MPIQSAHAGGHLSGKACSHQMADAFLVDPTARPNASCISQMSPPQWVVTPIQK
jgi:hypothetical protein